MNTLHKLSTILVACLLYSANTTAMLAQVARHKTSIASLSALSMQPNSGNVLCSTPTLPRTFSSSSARFAAQKTLKDILDLKTRNKNNILRTETSITNARQSGIIGASIMGVGGSGFCVLPAVAEMLKDTHPLYYFADLLNAVGLYGCPGIFMIGTGIAFTSACSLGLHSSRLGHLQWKGKYLEVLAKQAATESHQNSRVDAPKEKN